MPSAISPLPALNSLHILARFPYQGDGEGNGDGAAGKATQSDEAEVSGGEVTAVHSSLATQCPKELPSLDCHGQEEAAAAKAVSGKKRKRGDKASESDEEVSWGKGQRCIHLSQRSAVRCPTEPPSLDCNGQEEAADDKPPVKGWDATDDEATESDEVSGGVTAVHSSLAAQHNALKSRPSSLRYPRTGGGSCCQGCLGQEVCCQVCLGQEGCCWWRW